MSEDLNTFEPGFSDSPQEVESGAFGSSVEDGPAMAAMSGMLPAYEIMEQIERGGQGVIYKAVHKYTHRVVAIKVMTEGPFAGEMHRSRFQREAKMLARMKHANIVAIHESGVADGYHYFVMDFIDGRPLIDCQTPELKAPELKTKTGVGGGVGDMDVDVMLRCFVKVCDAVNAAHLQGIIHRDLKPSNILVDGEGEPFVLDFGLAKHDSDDRELSMLTTTGQFLGSLPWASPEQVEAKPDQIDLRTDVYALGVILYQLLTGRFPYPVVGPTREVLNHIVHTEPENPVAGGVGDAGIDEEVQTIVMRCLQKEAGKRYQTAGDLGRDIARYLAGEPIEAKRDSMAYLVRKRIYRYRVQMVVAGLFCVVTFAGLIGSLVLWQQAEESRLNEVSHRNEAELLTSMMREMIATADPANVKGADYTVREMLDAFVEGVAERTAGMPMVEGKLRQTISEAYQNMEDYVKSRRQSALALAAFDLAGLKETLAYGQTLGDHAMSQVMLGQSKAAEGGFREALNIFEGLENASHCDILKTRLHLAQCLASQGKHDEVEGLLAPGGLLDHATASERTEMGFEILHASVFCLNARDEYAEARTLLLEAVGRVESHYGVNHLELSRVYSGLGYVEKMMGNSSKSFEYYKKTVDIKEPLYGGDNERLLLYKLSSANLLFREGASSMAMDTMEEALRARKKYDIAISLNSRNLINRLVRVVLEGHLIKGNLGFAEEYWACAIRWYNYEPGVNDRVTAAIFRGIAIYDGGELEVAQAFLKEELVKVKRGMPNDEISYNRMVNAYAYCMRELEDVDEAERLMGESTRILFTHPDSKLNAVLRPASIRAAIFYRAIGREDEAKRWAAIFEKREAGQVGKARDKPAPRIGK